MAMEVDEGDQASNSNCLVAAAAYGQASKNTPTPQELKLWREIADWIDRKEHGELESFDHNNLLLDSLLNRQINTLTLSSSRSQFE